MFNAEKFIVTQKNIRLSVVSKLREVGDIIINKRKEGYLKG